MIKKKSYSVALTFASFRLSLSWVQIEKWRAKEGRESGLVRRASPPFFRSPFLRCASTNLNTWKGLYLLSSTLSQMSNILGSNYVINSMQVTAREFSVVLVSRAWIGLVFLRMFRTIQAVPGLTTCSLKILRCRRSRSHG